MKPFLKSLGGKRKQALQILSHFDTSHHARYQEPFVGGGAVFFALRESGYTGPALLGDRNPDLIAAYRAVRDTPDQLISVLQKLRNTEEEFYRLRALVPQSPLARAARFLFLNKTCFNGLWRVNADGQMNSPFGFYDDPAICDPANLRACSQALQGVSVNEQSFDRVEARAGDFIYCDSPYVALSKTAMFTGYTAGGFTQADQVCLRDAALGWAAQGATVLLSNADTPGVRELYSGGFALHEVQAPRAINVDATKRGNVGELLMVIGSRVREVAV